MFIRIRIAYIGNLSVTKMYACLCTHCCFLSMIKSSGRLTILKYQRNLHISPMIGRPMSPGGIFSPFLQRRRAGSRNLTSFQCQISHKRSGKPATITRVKLVKPHDETITNSNLFCVASTVKQGLFFLFNTTLLYM